MLGARCSIDIFPFIYPDSDNVQAEMDFPSKWFASPPTGMVLKVDDQDMSAFLTNSDKSAVMDGIYFYHDTDKDVRVLFQSGKYYPL